MAEASNTASDGQLTFKVKCAGDKLHTVTIAESATVLQLKTLLAGEEYENVAPEQQRLIYSGKVMKDDEVLSFYKIKHMNTVHMVKRPASAATASSGSTSTPAQPAIPRNMAAGTPSDNLLAGLTGARFAGQVPLPSRDLFGPDGGMGAPQTEEELADLLSNPNVAQAMNEAFNNPAVIDMMINSNPMFANMPREQARALITSPMMREMMTNPESIRMAARMRRMMGGDGASAFPAPGVTDNTPSAATGAGNNNTNANAQNPFGMLSPFGAPPAGNPFAALFGNPAGASPTPASGASTEGARSGDATSPPAGSAAGGATAGSGQQANPLASLFGALGGAGQPGQGGAANPFGLPPISPEALQQMMQALGGGGAGQGGAANPFGLPPIPPEALQQMMQAFGGGGLGGGSPAAPPDNRPPEERYAEQLRQLNDMGFFDFDRNVAALRRSGGSVQGAIEHLLNGS
ncbi:hypothetical protein B0T20DRAFT_471759 [Sordaria brevicollis]|uniref:Deubiquitination-protection protein dph1 n=1 Tax=Sordaria brevicollis TaxID=83679 RepID=A0AAE0P924_SORBR|nr:hypothetical protein B0T20DRAFT_471759 [Sordaria brevicollis]